MHLDGSCHCGAVKFSLNAAHPYPFNVCYCSICRKTAGGGGYAINLGADFKTLKVEGQNSLSVYRAKLSENAAPTSMAERSFCRICASALWVWDPRWPELIHPFASAIDTELPAAPERTHLFLNSKANWVPLNIAREDKCFDGYPEESLAQWHRRLGLEVDDA